MAPLSLRIVQDNGVVTKKVKLDPAFTVREAHVIVKDKTNVKENAETYGLFLRSVENELCGIWMEEHRTLSYYMLRDGDRLDYMTKIRNLKVKTLDDAVKTFQVDQSKIVADLVMSICSRLGITNHEEYGLCLDVDEETEENKDKGGAGVSATMKRKQKERDPKLEQLIIKLKTDDNVEWIDAHKTLSEAGVAPLATVLLMRRLYYSDRNVDARDPVQLGLLYVQTRDNILGARHPVTENQAGDCKVRWINIRDVHRRILRKNLCGYGRPARPYKYDQQLEFMKNFYKEVVTADPATDEEDNNDDNDDDKSSQVWNDVIIECNESEMEDEKPLKKVKKSKKTLKVKKFEEVDVSTASTAHDTTAYEHETSYDTSDPVDAFLLSIGATLKKFSPYHLNLAKSKIFHIVQEHDLQQIVEKQQGRLDSSVSSSEPIFYQTT